VSHTHKRYKVTWSNRLCWSLTCLSQQDIAILYYLPTRHKFKHACYRLKAVQSFCQARVWPWHAWCQAPRECFVPRGDGGHMRRPYFVMVGHGPLTKLMRPWLKLRFDVERQSNGRRIASNGSKWARRTYTPRFGWNPPNRCWILMPTLPKCSVPQVLKAFIITNYMYNILHVYCMGKAWDRFWTRGHGTTCAYIVCSAVTESVAVDTVSGVSKHPGRAEPVAGEPASATP